ncbi:MAG: TrmB family transcriptional regulator [Candidatus Sabulitectum sp.]|nr:TrmB family transcriptional regulator [Candidatus Sabulitectum sp.]
MNEHQSRIDALSELGLTDLEARIYVQLTKSPMLSGYRVAKILGRSVPNIYNTLSSMAKKGLVLTSLEGTTNIYIPTPLDEYLEQYSRRTDNLIDRTREVFKNIGMHEENPSPEIFQLENTEQVLQKARKLIGDAKGKIVITADRFPLLHLSPYLREAADRGVSVLVNNYIHHEIPGCDVINWTRRTERRSWPGNWLLMAADANEMLLCFFSLDEKVVNAFWAKNRFLSVVFQHGRSADTVLASVLNMLKDDVPLEELKQKTLSLTEKHIYGISHIELFDTIHTELESPSG